IGNSLEVREARLTYGARTRRLAGVNDGAMGGPGFVDVGVDVPFGHTRTVVVGAGILRSDDAGSVGEGGVELHAPAGEIGIGGAIAREHQAAIDVDAAIAESNVFAPGEHEEYDDQRDAEQEATGGGGFGEAAKIRETEGRKLIDTELMPSAELRFDHGRDDLTVFDRTEGAREELHRAVRELRFRFHDGLRGGTPRRCPRRNHAPWRKEETPTPIMTTRSC